MKKNKILITTGLLVLSLGSLISCGDNTNQSSLSVVSDLSLSDTNVEMLFGDTYELVAKGASSPLTWTSSNENVLTVDDGSVNAVGEGEADIIVSDGSSRASCHFSVTFKDLLPALLIDNLSADSISLVKGSSFALRGNALFNGKIYSCPISIIIDDEEMLTLDGNSLVGKKAGTSEVTIKGNWNNFDNPLMEKTIKVTVSDDISMYPKVTIGSNSFVTNDLELALVSSWEGKEYDTSANVEFVVSSSGIERKATLSIEDNSVASLDEFGNIKAKKTGSTKLHGTYTDNEGNVYTSFITITVFCPVATNTKQLKISAESPFPVKEYFGTDASIVYAKQGDRELKFLSNGFIKGLEAKGDSSEPLLVLTTRGGYYFSDTFVYTRSLTKDNFASTFMLSEGKIVDGYYILEEDILTSIDMTKQISSYYQAGNAKNCYFKGTFDGQGHTISAKVAREGIFGGLGETALIKNTHFNFTFNSKDYCSGLARNNWTNQVKGWKATLSDLYITTTNYYDHSYSLFEVRFNDMVMENIYVKLTLDENCKEVTSGTQEKGALFRVDNTITNGPYGSYHGDFQNIYVVSDVFMPIASGYVGKDNLFVCYAKNDKDKLGSYERGGIDSQIMCCAVGSKNEKGSKEAALFGSLPGCTWYFSASKNTTLVWVYEAEPAFNNGGIKRYNTVEDLRNDNVSKVGSWNVE